MTSSTNDDETVDGSGVAERLQAVEALCTLARSFGGGGGGGGKGKGKGKGDARSAAIAAAAGGGAEAQGKRLTKTAEFLLEAGFFAPAEGGLYLDEACVLCCVCLAKCFFFFIA